MNLQALFKKQRELDERIVKEKGLEGQDLLPKKILALQVELGELANELPEVFKFWSNKKNNRQNALKEFVDGLHFIISVILEKAGYLPDTIPSYDYHTSSSDRFDNSDLTNHFNCLFLQVQVICTYNDSDVQLRCLLGMYLALGEKLGFTWEQIETAYHEKHAVNVQRQESGY